MDRQGILLSKLEVVVDPTWSERCLLSCLRALRQEGPTHGHLVKVVDAWCGPDDAVSIVYQGPWSSELLGLYRCRESSAIGGLPDFNSIDAESVMNAELFGVNIAIYDLGVPSGWPPDSLWRDSAGLRWWGDLWDNTG